MREAAEASKHAAEASRAAAEEGTKAAEAGRAAAEDATRAAKSSQTAAEEGTKAAEASRAAAEQARMAAEASNNAAQESKDASRQTTEAALASAKVSEGNAKQTEGQSVNIFIFTLITAIFTPMSFTTSVCLTTPTAKTLSHTELKLTDRCSTGVFYSSLDFLVAK